MPNRTGIDADYTAGAVKGTWVDQGDGTWAKRIVIGAAGGTKSWGQMTLTGNATIRVASDKRKSLMVKSKSNSTGIAYIGGSGVTASDGFELKAGEGTVLDQSTDIVAVAIPSGTVNLFWLEERIP